MRHLLLLLCAIALAGCDGAEPPVEPAGEALVVPPPPPRIPEPGPQVAIRPMDALPAQTDAERARAEASRRELDQRAAALPADIAGARQRAEDARRGAQPAAPPASPTPTPGPAPAPSSASPAARTPTPPPSTPAPATTAPTPAG